MARFNNVDAPIGNIEELTCNRVYTDRVSSNDYVGLPIASLMKHGVVKIDGTSITIDENGVISARLVFDNESMESHIANNDIHMLQEDRNNLIMLGTHMSSSTLHFTFQEKQSVLNDLKAAKDHATSPHLSQGEASYLKTHVADSWLHFDDLGQKQEVLGFIRNFPIANLNSPNKFLITDNAGRVVLSSASSNLLNFLPDLQVPLLDYLSEHFQEKGTSGNSGNTVDLDDVYGHIENTDVHITSDEKQSIYDEIEALKLDKSDEVFAKKEDLVGLARDEHLHTSLDVKHNDRYLYAILTEITNDIQAIKGDVQAIKEDMRSIRNGIDINDDSINAINQEIIDIKTKMELYHPSVPE